MKVAIVYPFFAHYRSAIINELLRSDEFEFYFIGGLKKNKSFSSLKLHDFNYSDRFIQVNNFWFFNHFLWQSGLIRSLLHKQFDFVILLGDWKYFSSWLSLILLKFKKVPIYFWGHGILSLENTINSKLKIIFLKLFDGGFLYSHRAMEIMFSLGFKNNLSVVYNSLDYDVANALIRKTIIDKNESIIIPKPYVIFTGRIVLERKLEILFDSIQSLKERGIYINALIVGEGPYLNYYKEFVDNLNLNDSILFYGSCYDEEKICKFYLNSIACVFPGPIGLTAIHSLTYGIPVITNDCIEKHKPEIESIMDNINGFLYKNDDFSSLALKIVHVLNMSELEREQISNNAKKVILEKYNPAVQKERFSKVIRTVLNND